MLRSWEGNRESSDTGTNLKVKGHRSGAKMGAPIRREAPGKKIFWSCPSTFLALKV